MKRLSIVAALVAIGVAVPLSIGSSHREAPLTSIDPTADDTDVYAYTAKDAQDALTVVANWVPFEDPAGGPNFYKFDQKARYYINIDNTGDGKYDVRYRFTFRDKYENGGSSFLYALPGVSSIDDPKLLQKQFYDVERLSYGYAKSASASKKGQEALAQAQGRASTRRRKHQQALEAACCAACARLPATSRSRRTTSGRRRSRTTTRSPTRRSPSCPVAARCSPASVTTRSSWTSGTTFDAINLEGRRDRRDKAAARTTSPATACTRSSSRCPRRRSPGTATRSTPPTDKNAVVGVWASTERKRVSVLASQPRRRRRRRRTRRLGAGLPAREPARERGHHPGRAEGPVQPHDSGPRRRAVRRASWSSRSWRRS